MDSQMKIGDRVTLISMGPDPAPLEPGLEGTITWLGPIIGDGQQFGVTWDNGRTLGLVIPPDRVVVTRRLEVPEP